MKDFDIVPIIYVLVGGLITFGFDRWKDRGKEKRNAVNELVRTVSLFYHYEIALSINQNIQLFVHTKKRFNSSPELKPKLEEEFDYYLKKTDEYFKLTLELTAEMAMVTTKVSQYYSGLLARDVIKEVDNLIQESGHREFYDFKSVTVDNFNVMQETFSDCLQIHQGKLNKECNAIIKKIRAYLN